MNTKTNKYINKSFSKNPERLHEHKEQNFDTLNNLSITELVDTLKNTHEKFVNSTIPQIEQNFLLLSKYYSNNNSVATLLKLFVKFQRKFQQHLVAEERTMFAYSINLDEASANSDLEKLTQIKKNKYSSENYGISHSDSEVYVTEIVQLLEKQVELNEPITYTILLRQLKQFDQEIKIHSWIEDNILVNKVNDLEKSL